MTSAPRPAAAREWLLTNGLGGLAFGTEHAYNTRRYHGLLVAALHPPVGRTVILHSTAEQIDADGRTVQIARHLFGPDAEAHPAEAAGWSGFQRDAPDTVSWRCSVNALELNRRVRLAGNANGVSITYGLSGRLPAVFRVRPLTPLRGFHGLSREGDAAHRPAEVEHVGPGGLLLRRGELRIRLFVRSSLADVRAVLEPQWWRGLSYSVDRQRGQEFLEDVWSPGVFEFHLDEAGTADAAHPVELRFDVEVGSPLLPPVPPAHGDRPASTGDSAHARLDDAADQFLVWRLSQDRQRWTRSIVAGYPWFADWGRDAMICVPGLLLSRGRVDDAASVLDTFAGAIRNGLVPNCFLDDGGALYNSVDAGLWFIHAVARSFDQLDAARRARLLHCCRDVIHAYRRGTDFDIRMEPDGLIAAGNPDTQITWMDAARDGVVFTPRHGKAVEINALWYNALCSTAQMIGDDAEARELHDVSKQVQQAFIEQFWWPQRECLHDVLVPAAGGAFIADGKLRPNQIFAVSLPHSPLDTAMQRSVVRAVEQHLLTPFGLRTLDPEDADYRGRFEGDLFQRDAAYHQGTAWPWLLGPFCDALLRINRFDRTSRQRAGEIIAPMLAELDSGCVGQLAEVYDGDPPHRPDGCIAQAWTVAELLRVLTLLDV